MKALVYTGTQLSEIRDVEEPIQSDGMVVVDLEYCGICGSDMHAWHGHDARRVPPLVLGHEAIGFAQSGKYAGKRVALNPLMTCGQCDMCQNGKEHLCAERELIGMRVPGAFAQKVSIKEENIFPVPDGLAPEVAALVEPLAVVVHAINLGRTPGSNFYAGKKIAVIGGGAIGLLSAKVFELEETARLVVAETNGLRSEMLSKVLDAEIINPMTTQEDFSNEFDVVLDAVGSGKTRALASEITKPGGLVIHLGLQDQEAGLDTRKFTLQEIAFVGSYCYTNADFQEALDLLAAKKITFGEWCEIRPLDEGAQSFMDIHNGSAPPKIILKIA